MLALACLHLVGFLAVYLIAACTPFGQRAENGLFTLNADKPAWIHDWSGGYHRWAMPPLDEMGKPTLIVGIVVLVAVILVRRCWWPGIAAIGVVLVTFGATEVLHRVLPRPDLVGAPQMLVDPSFPSGHLAIPAGLGLGAILVASPRIRPYVTAAGTLWLAVTAAAILATYQHRPSDVLGATLLACACYSLAARFLPVAAAPVAPQGPRRLRAITLTLTAAIVLTAGARDDSVTDSLTFAAVAFLCAALFWYTATKAHQLRP